MTELRKLKTKDWRGATTLSVATYSWRCANQPKTTAEVMLVEAEGLYVRLTCEEQNPRAVFTEPDCMVCQDSCLECFINCAPEKSTEYLNLESNAKGSMYASFGAARTPRRFLREMNVPMATVTPTVEQDRWSVTYHLPMALIEALYGKCALAEGDELMANFYKCGDHTESPHYGSWQPIDAPEPDFHRPEFFGHLRIVNG